MNDQDQHNLVRFLQDLAGVTDGNGKGFDAADLADYQDRASARPPLYDLAGLSVEPYGPKRPQEASGKQGEANSRGPLDA